MSKTVWYIMSCTSVIILVLDLMSSISMYEQRSVLIRLKVVTIPIWFIYFHNVLISLFLEFFYIKRRRNRYEWLICFRKLYLMNNSFSWIIPYKVSFKSFNLLLKKIVKYKDVYLISNILITVFSLQLILSENSRGDK